MTHRHYDIVIVVCGTAGLTAGLCALEEDVDVGVLDKPSRKRRGGHTRFTKSLIPTAGVGVNAEFDGR
jgi:tricarballylate dehydrogenase